MRLSQLPDGTQLTQAETHDLERDVIREVRSRPHTRASGWEAGVGPTLTRSEALSVANTERAEAQRERDDYKAMVVEMRERQTRLEEEMRARDRDFQGFRSYMAQNFPNFPPPTFGHGGSSSSQQPPPTFAPGGSTVPHDFFDGLRDPNLGDI